MLDAEITFYETVMRESDASRILSHLSLALTGMGFPATIYVNRSILQTEPVRLIDEGVYLLPNCPPEIAGLIAELSSKDNWLAQWASTHDGVISWGEVQRAAQSNLLSDAQSQTHRDLRAKGLRAGYVLSFRDQTAHQHGAFFLCAPLHVPQAELEAIWSRFGRLIVMRCRLVHLRLSSLPGDGGLAQSLTPRQREVLEWVAMGKTAAEIAVILGLRPATVEKHLRLVREGLNAQTTVQAVLNALLRRQIFIGRTSASRGSD